MEIITIIIMNTSYLTVECKWAKMSICLTMHSATQMCGEVEIQLHAFFTSALDIDELSASRPGCFTPEQRTLVPTGQEAGWAVEPI
jgi:hypothetical protein